MLSAGSSTLSTTSGESYWTEKPKMERTGTVVIDLNGHPEIVKLHLTEEALTLYREEFAYTFTAVEKMDTNMLSKERSVTIRREKVGGLGLSVKGGNEHHLPVLVSRIFKDQAADKTGQLFVGDAILKVNDTNIESFSHDEAVNALKQAGDKIHLLVKYFRPASVFLHHSSLNSTSDLDNGNPPGSPTSLCDDVFQAEQQWTELLSIPLLCAYVTRYLPGTDEIRPETFELYSMDGVSTGAIQCEDHKSAINWINAISYNINKLNTQSIILTNKTLQPENQVYHMCWVCERVNRSKLVRQNWKRVFLAFKGSDVCIFEAPPVKTKDWVKCESMDRIYECMLRPVKDRDLEDGREHCCVIETGPGSVHYVSVETKVDLYKIEKAWYHCNFMSIKHLQTKTYGCMHNSRLSGLTLDLIQGFSLYDSEEKAYTWSYKFSQLKGSSDDGKSLLRLHFMNDTTNILEMREIDCTNLRTVLFAMQAFLCAKLATVDPAYHNYL